MAENRSERYDAGERSTTREQRIADLESRIIEYEMETRRIGGELFALRRAAAEHRVSREPLTRQLLHEMDLALRMIQRTRFWQLRNVYMRLKSALRLGTPTVPFDFSKRIAALETTDAYQEWLRWRAPREADLEQMKRVAAILPRTPTISVLVPVYDPPEPYLRAMIDSVLAQVYPHWQLCLADDASPSPHVRAVLDEYASVDPRIRVVYRPENGHIARASNDALAVAEGEFVALLDHDDLLTPDALFEVALFLQDHPNADMIYSDEDKVNDDGALSNPYFKPDWSPDTFLTRMYTAHLGVYRRELVRSLGGFRVGFEGSQDYDLVLRLTEQTDRIHHIPRVLYHWRVHSGSVAGGSSAKPYAYEAALRALGEALDRRDEGGRVERLGEDYGSYVIRYTLRHPEKVSIIIPTRDLSLDVDRCLTSIFTRSTYQELEVVLIDNGSRDKHTFEVFERWSAREPKRLRVLRHDIPFNYSRLNNYGVAQADGSTLIFLNNDTEILTDEWIEAMLEQSQRPSIGAVGAKLLYGDGSVQHAGVVIRVGGIAGHAFRFFPHAHPGYFNSVSCITNVTAVTAACMAVRRSVFEEVGGFDEELAVAYNDVDLCMKIVAAGYRNIYLPHVVIHHFESKSRGYDVTKEQVRRDRQERALMERKWNISKYEDRCYNPNLTLLREDFGLGP